MGGYSQTGVQCNDLARLNVWVMTWPLSVRLLYRPMTTEQKRRLTVENARTRSIAKINDQFRKNLGLSFHSAIPGMYIMTRGIKNLDIHSQKEIVKQVREFDQFSEENDPYGEHDFGSLIVENKKIFWKIDYYDKTYRNGSEDPADIKKTNRVLTIMLACEY
jgi:hypothetical protein